MTVPATPEPTLDAIRVLLVEDDDSYAALLTAELSLCPLPVALTRARSLAEARALLPAASADVILLDLGLPDSDGLATLERMQQNVSDVPVVVLTARNDDALAIAAMQQGAEDYLVKGSTEPELLARALRYARERMRFRRALLDREEELRQAHKMEAVGRLAGGVAHDFNNVLTAIFGYADLLLDQFEGDDPRRHDVEEIRRSAERAASLTRQLLAFSRKQVMQPRLLDLNEVIVRLEKLLSRLVSEDVTVKVTSASDLWRVRADPGQIEQVLMNLCANGRDAMPEGGTLHIHTENREVDAGEADRHPGLTAGPHVLLTVEDTGHGMPEAVRRNVFEPFFTTKEQGKGTGLGLATVYGIVKQTGGAIYVESEEGNGTRFIIYLPKVDEARPEPATTSA